jgi:hypothetical protein
MLQISLAERDLPNFEKLRSGGRNSKKRLIVFRQNAVMVVNVSERENAGD